MTDRPILVTGAAGFIGARLVEALNARGAALVSCDEASFFATRPEHAGLDFGEVVDRDALFAWLDAGAEVAGCLHMGACADTRVKDRALFDRLNLDYSKELWQRCVARNVPFVYASSASTYGDGTHGYVDDEHLIPMLEPMNEYGRSKHLFDLWALGQEQDGNAPGHWSGFKFFNVYGFGERHKGEMASVVLKAFDQIRARGRVRLFRSHHPDYADGEQTRDFVSVEDVVEVVLFALDKPIRRGVFNLGTGKGRTFKDLVLATFAALDVPPDIEWVDTPEDIRDQYQYFTQADMARLRGEGYDAPFLELEDGVARYVARLREAAGEA
ncbi:MAG: ADP-glyceromanno-heptose 6-epimerase [Planctomycetota bacterium]